jgi:MoxR-like ATPase
VTTPALVEAINAALHLRRPLLLTGPPGSGKSSVINLIAAELELGPVLRWHVTSKSVLKDALFDYDALGRLQATQVSEANPNPINGSPDPRVLSIDRFVALGPLGTALASQEMPRAVLIDEIDKSDLDLHGDLLNVLENGEFDIPPLIRDAGEAYGAPAPVRHEVRGADGASYEIWDGSVRAQHFPVIVMTSNGERTMPAAFLRRCISFKMPAPDVAFLSKVIDAHLGQTAAQTERNLIAGIAASVSAGRVAIDQLLNLVYLVTGDADPDQHQREKLRTLLLAEIGDL